MTWSLPDVNALDRHAWDDAYEGLTHADTAGSLDGEGLRLLSEAAYRTVHPEPRGTRGLTE
jgi:hypothetical protein